MLSQRTAKLVRRRGIAAGQYSASLRFTRDLRGALAHARAAVVASGTATVEAALAATPMVVVYRVAPLSWLMGRRLVRVPHIAMVNLLASGWNAQPAPYATNAERLVPEFVQQDFTPQNVARELERLGCTHAQGFHFSPPLPMQAAEALLSRARPLGDRRPPIHAVAHRSRQTA